MQENFKEKLNRKIANDYANNIISKLHDDLRIETNTLDSNLYDMIQSIETSGRNDKRRKREAAPESDLQLALRLFLHKFLEENKKDIEETRRKHIVNQIVELKLQKTSNDKYLQDDNGNYYMLVNNNYLKQENILEIRDDGSYLTNEKIENSEYYLQKLLTKNDEELELRVFHPENGFLQSSTQIVKILGMKKEVVNKYKKNGYSGNSFDYIANLINFFNTPEASGYYMCKNCHFWKWSFKDSSFKRDFRNGLTKGSPELADYEYKDNNTVIRTDYSGKGLKISI